MGPFSPHFAWVLQLCLREEHPRFLTLTSRPPELLLDFWAPWLHSGSSALLSKASASGFSDMAAPGDNSSESTVPDSSCGAQVAGGGGRGGDAASFASSHDRNRISASMASYNGGVTLSPPVFLRLRATSSLKLQVLRWPFLFGDACGACRWMARNRSIRSCGRSPKCCTEVRGEMLSQMLGWQVETMMRHSARYRMDKEARAGITGQGKRRAWPGRGKS